MRFKVWYADGTDFEGETREDWKRAPQMDIVCIAQKNHFPPGGDYYWMDESGWINHSNSGRSLARKFKTSIEGLDMVKEVKQGVTVSYSEYNRLLGIASKWAGGGCCGD